MTTRRTRRRRAALVVLLPALLSVAWLGVWERATRGGCCDDVCVCATLCASRVSCHGDHGGAKTRLARACSRDEEPALLFAVPAVLTAVDGGHVPVPAHAVEWAPPLPLRLRTVPPEPHPPPRHT